MDGFFPLPLLSGKCDIINNALICIYYVRQWHIKFLFVEHSVYCRYLCSSPVAVLGNDVVHALAISDSESGKIFIYDGKGEDKSLHVLDKLHSKPIKLIEYNSRFDCVISVDVMGMLEYWSGPKCDYEFPSNVKWKYKTDTDLYEFVKVTLCFYYAFFAVMRYRKRILTKGCLCVRLLRFFISRFTKVAGLKLWELNLHARTDPVPRMGSFTRVVPT
ncbi:unnamed protein product [Gongylonema pulchrum]|uniref:DNA_pol_B_exo1 domain-containing protein n=1 Tax=Gongylonema pulchrum TaxID=637853 RepID=A0A183CZW9_9BILA|nr:unnamed protein product [Gongylonema pulchrum]